MLPVLIEIPVSLRVRWLSSTVFAGLAMAASPGCAACAPDPTVAGTTTNCTGADEDGLTVTTSNTNVVVAQGASISFRPDKVGALVLQNGSSQATVTLTNSGAISSTDGPAVTNVNPSSFASITNQAGAVISGTTGGIVGTPNIPTVEGRLTNAGLIDGGAGSALSGSFGSIVNSGTIRSSGTAATIAMPNGGPQQFSNSGTIVNLGSGAAIDTGNGSLNLSNQAGGVIGTGGSVAVRSTFQVQIVNAGTINGSVFGGSGFSDLVDTRDGMINGDVLLNDGNDRLIATLGASTLVSGVSGTVDGGNGTDLLELIVRENRSLSNVVLPSGFELLQLNLQNDATLTVSGSTLPDGGYSVRGNGTLAFGSDMTVNGPIIRRQVAQQNLGAETLKFTNDRVITTTLVSASDVAISLENISAATNSGTIRATGGNGVNFRLNSAGLITNAGLIEATETALTVNGSVDNQGTIRSTNGIALQNDPAGGRTSTNFGLIDGRTIGASISNGTLVNSGTIQATNGVGVRGGSSTLQNKAGGTITGTTAAITGGNLVIMNEGLISGAVDFSAAFSSRDIYLDQGGSLTGNLLLGDGNDFYIADVTRGLAGASGTIDGGSGVDTLRLRTAVNRTTTIVAPPVQFERVGYEVENGATLTVTSSAPLTTSVELTGTGRIDLTANLSPTTATVLDLSTVPTAKLLDPTVRVTGNLRVLSRGTLTLDTATPGGNFAAVYALNNSSNDDRIIAFENHGTINVIGPVGSLTGLFAVRGGDDVVNVGTINLQSSYGIYEAASFTNSGTITEAASSAGMAVGTVSTPVVVNNGTILVNGVGIFAGGGFSSQLSGLTLDNTGLVESRSAAGINGSANVRTAVIRNTGGTIRGKDVAINIDGSTQLTNTGLIDGQVLLTTINNSGVSDSSIDNSGTITGAIRFGNRNDRLTNSGTLGGAVDLGNGSDTVVIRQGAVFGGSVTGGAGNDTIRLETSGTSTAPATVDFRPFSAFERLENASGTALISSSLAFPQIDVTGGRLIGGQGTVLTGNVAVSAGGTFGSAGTVIGNVSVATGGVLSPGASPGIMTVNGNLSLASGSTTLFELVPIGQSDQIVISNGTLTIASGAILNVTGAVAPGASLDLIVVNGGTINGSFSTVNLDPGLSGLLNYSSGKVSLLGSFATPSGASLQVASGIAYVNSLLAAGQASSPLVLAIPSLLSNGTTNVAAFARITPEPYASASQLGVEQGLSLARSLRANAVHAPAQDAGLHAFGEAIGNWRNWKGGAGTSAAKSSSSGVLAGIGYGTQQLSAGVFAGYVDSRQTIANLDARTDADGMIAGVTLRYATGAFDLSASLAHSWSAADTRRSTPGSSVAVAHYDLHSFVLDAAAGYRMEVGPGWTVRPEAGITHVSTKREAALESGGSAFALTVQGRRTDATFVDGGIHVMRDQLAIRPWARAGLRYQLQGRSNSATAGLIGATSQMSVSGVRRSTVTANGSAGASADLTPRLTLSGSYQLDVGGGTGHNVMLALRLTM